MISIIEQIDENSFIGKLHNVKVYGTVAEDRGYDVYAFPITGTPDLQVTDAEISYI